MRYDYELTLIDIKYIEDEIGNQMPSETKTIILCDKKSVTRNEFYNASIAGLKPQVVFIVHGYEYNGETNVEFEGQRHKVIRTYQLNFEEMEIICEKV